MHFGLCQPEYNPLIRERRGHTCSSRWASAKGMLSPMMGESVFLLWEGRQT